MKDKIKQAILTILQNKRANGDVLPFATSIEVDLKTYKVMQSRGLQNKMTDQHKTILQLMADNMCKIEAINKQRKTI